MSSTLSRMRLAASIQIQAVTRKQFDTWSASKKRQYLDRHPYSSFHDRVDPSPKKIEHPSFTDSKGTTHVYRKRQDLETHLDDLHEDQDRLAKLWHSASSPAQKASIKKQMNHNAGIAQGIAKIAQSGYAVRNSNAHEGLDSVQEYLDYHAPKKAQPSKTSPVKLPSHYKDWLKRTQRDPIPKTLLQEIKPHLTETDKSKAASSIQKILEQHYSSYLADAYTRALLDIPAPKLTPGSTADGVDITRKTASEIMKLRKAPSFK